MSGLNSCSKCGGPLPIDGALGGGCPRCMLELGFDTSVGSRESPDPGVAAERPRAIGRYRIDPENSPSPLSLRRRREA